MQQAAATVLIQTQRFKGNATNESCRIHLLEMGSENVKTVIRIPWKERTMFIRKMIVQMVGRGTEMINDKKRGRKNRSKHCSSSQMIQNQRHG
jgi:hypothetical protein